VAIALLLAAYHLWDLRLRPTGTGLSVRLVSQENADRVIAADSEAIVLDTRLHGSERADGQTVRIPRMELDRRLSELEPYRKSPVFVLAPSEPQAAAAAAFLARRGFEQVAYIRIPKTASVQARTEGERAPVD
jgi:hypothetical protein